MAGKKKSKTPQEAVTTNGSASLKPKLEEEQQEKRYEEKDVIYHISGVETCFIDPQGSGSSSMIPLSQDDDLYVILCPPEGIDDPASEGLPPEILYLKAGRISCPLSPSQPTMRRNHQEVRLAYLFPMEIALDDSSECNFVVFVVILPATLQSLSPIVLGFEDLLHKFTLFTVDDEEQEKPKRLEDAPPLPKSVEDTESEWDLVYTVAPVHCCVIDLDAIDDEDDEEEQEGEEGSYDMGQSKLNILLFPPQEMIAVQVATKSVLLSRNLTVKRKFYEDGRLVYFFPFSEKVDEEDEDESEMVLTAVMPLELTENSPEIIGLEDILYKFANLAIEEIEVIEEPKEEVDPNAPLSFEKPELAIKIERTGYKVRSAIVQSAVHLGRGIFWTSNYINKHVRPNQKPTKVSKKTMARIYNARVISGKVFGASVKTLNMWNIGYKKIGSMTVSIFAHTPLYKKLTSGATTKNQAAIRDLFGASTEAVMGLYYGLKDAGRILGECSKAATVNVIQHKWGDEAGYAAQESLNVVRDLALAGWYAYNALTPSWQQVAREGSYELFDQLTNFRNWTSARVLRTGTLYFKLPLLISSNYSIRFAVMTEECFLIFYDKEHYLRSMEVSFPDRTEIFEAVLRGDVVVRDWHPGMKVPGVDPKSPEEKKKKKKKKKRSGEDTENGEEGEGQAEGEDSQKEEGAETEGQTNDAEAEAEEEKVALGAAVAATAVAAEAEPDSSDVKPMEVALLDEDEMPPLEPADDPFKPPKRYKPKHGNPLEVREISSVDKTKFKRSGFAGIKDMKIRGKAIKTKKYYRKMYMYVMAMPLEEMDYVRYEDQREDLIQRHTREHCFSIQTRDGTWSYYSCDTFVECMDWVDELNKWVVFCKEKRANKLLGGGELTVDSPNLPKYSDHDYVSWLPKELPRPKTLPSPMEVKLLPKKMLSSTELVRETLHED